MSGMLKLQMETIREATRALLAMIDERARRILDARFGIVSGQPKTLQAIGNTEHLTRERIRQIEVSAMSLLRAPDATLPPVSIQAREHVRELLASLGGAALEDTLLAALNGRNGRDRAALRFLLSSLSQVAEASETRRTHAHWTLTDGFSRGGGPEKQTLEGILETAEHLLQRAGHVLPEQELFSDLRSELLTTTLTEEALRSLLAVGKSIIRTPFGEWGLRGWTDAMPRGAGDKAYVVLRRAGKPLHFTAIAEAIDRAGFDAKHAHPQTVHNELIRSKRFVLVGRGLYGLREWGYEPGTVADVIVRVLTNAGRPLPKTELTEAALKQRLVKRNTVLLALQNRALFTDLGDGTYALTPAAPTAPRPGRGSGAPTPPASGSAPPTKGKTS